jgi:hypothetical protein
MIFPENKLPLSSQPWGREVTKQLSTAISQISSERVNNTARDNQLNSSIIANQAATVKAQTAADAAAAAAVVAGAAATKAQSIIDNIYVTGTEEIDGAALAAASLSGAKLVDGTVPGGKVTANTITATQIATNYVYAGTINAGQITAGTITGDFINGGTITGSRLKTAASGERVEIGVDTFGTVSFFNSTAKIGSIYAATLEGNNWITIDSSYTYVYNYMSVGGSLNVNDSIYAGFLQVDSDSFNVVSNGTTTEVRSRAIFDAGTAGAVNLHIQGSGNNYRIYRNTSASTREIKKDIRPLDFDKDAYINIEPVVFKYVDGILREEEKDSDIIGFIAEDFVDAGFSEHLVTQPQTEDEYMSLRYDKMYMFLHGVVKSQQDTIKELNSRLEALENK